MNRPTGSATIDEILRAAMEPVLKRASASIARSIAELAAEQLEQELRSGVVSARGRRGAGRSLRPPRRPREEITRWVADRRARRVPKFVIEMTNGLDTKKKIVARFGPDSVFEKGKPLPKPK
jgi:hypothetical protein